MNMTAARLVASFALILSAVCSQPTTAAVRPAIPERLFPFLEGERWGYISSSGEVVIQPCFQWADDFKDGRAYVHTEKGGGYIDEQGKLVFTLPEQLERATDFYDGLAAFSKNEKYGYLDRQGKVVVEPKYDAARRFSEGLAPVNVGGKSAGFPRPFLRKGGKWGFIDKTGRLVIPIQFEWVHWKGFSEGLAVVKLDDEYAWIDKTGKVIIVPSEKSDDPKRTIWYANAFSEGLAQVSASSGTNSRSGFIDKTGKYAINPRFEQARDFSEGLAAVAVGKKWGYIDRNGRIVIQPQFDETRDFSEGLAPVRKGEQS